MKRPVRGRASSVPPERTGPPGGRLVFIDAARALAVGLTMYSHALVAFGVWGRETVTAVRYFVQAAPPLFIVMFGMMLELVYAPRLESGAAGPVARRFLVRAAQCYLGFAATALAAFAAGEYTARQLATALLLRHQVPFGTILVFYAFALLAAAPLLLLRRRFGTRGLLLLLVLVWASRPLLTAVEVGRGWWWMPLGTLVGLVGRPSGPSVLFGSTFLIAGMVLAEPLRDRARLGLGPFLRRAGQLAAAAAAVVAAHLLSAPPGEILRDLGDYRRFSQVYRRGEHPAYYGAGILAALGWLVLLARAVPRDRPLPVWAQAPLEFGRSALLAFILGNVLLILLPRGAVPGSGAGRVGAALAFVGVLLALLHAAARLRRALAPRGGPSPRTRPS